MTHRSRDRPNLPATNPPGICALEVEEAETREALGLEEAARPAVSAHLVQDLVRKAPLVALESGLDREGKGFLRAVVGRERCQEFFLASLEPGLELPARLREEGPLPHRLGERGHETSRPGTKVVG